MTWTLCTSEAAVLKAGTHANSAIIVSGAPLAVWSLEAEGRIELETRRTWVANHAGLAVGLSGALSDVCSSLIAMKIIGYDTTGYLTREADTLLNVNDDIASAGLKLLKDFKSNTLQTP